MVRGLVFGMGLLLAALVQAQEQAALAVEVAQAARVAHERSLAADGVVVARELAAVNAQVAGVSLARLEADIGDRVQAGQVLARFDAALLQQELAQAQAQEARAQAALAQAKRNAARAGKLVQERAVSVSDSEQLASAVREGQAALDGAVAAGGGVCRAGAACGFARQFVVARAVFARQGGGVDGAGVGAGARGRAGFCGVGRGGESCAAAGAGAG